MRQQKPPKDWPSSVQRERDPSAGSNSRRSTSASRVMESALREGGSHGLGFKALKVPHPA